MQLILEGFPDLVLKMRQSGEVEEQYAPLAHPLVPTDGAFLHLNDLLLDPPTKAFILTHFQLGESVSCDMPFTTQSGDLRTFQVRISVHNQSGWCIIEDITARKSSEALKEAYYNELLLSRQKLEAQSQQLILQAEELQTANANVVRATEQKMAFITQLSHELRTPLNGIMGIVQLMQHASQLTYEQQEYLDNIQSASSTLLHTINDVLDFSRLEAGQFTLNLEPCDLRVAINEAWQMVQGMIEQKHLDFVTFIDPQLPRSVLADNVRIRQLVLNLLSNACKYTPFGRITLNVKLKGICLADDGPPMARVCVEVTDTGIGIAEEKISALFQRFSQVHSADDTDHTFQSTGLGLSICKSIIALMPGGEIGVRSKLTEGSTFWFELDCTVITPTLAPSLMSASVATFAGPMPALAGRYLPYNTLLLIEENQSLWDTRKRCFEYLGLQVIIEPNLMGMLKHPLVDVVVLSYPLLEYDDMSDDLINEWIMDNRPLFLLVNRGVNPVYSHPITGILDKPLNTEHLYAQMHTPQIRGGASGGAKPIEPAVASNADHNIPEAVVIPLGQPPAGSDALPLNATTQAPPLLLVVEDNLVNQKVITKFLERLGYGADVCANGREALEKLDQHRYPLVLMDCQMPEMDGYEATRRIRQLPDERTKLPIIAMTAHVLAGERQKCIDAGMTDYIAKPIELELLRQMLDTYMMMLEAANT
jgi:signal transduction histidine kinase/ActR/RegA family two-component response regulator